MQPLPWVLLPFRFDPQRLEGDLAEIEEREWISHFNLSDYSGNWSGIALRSPTGAAAEIYSPPDCNEFRDTNLMQRCPYFREVIATFECPIKAVRLLRLAPGSRILEHRDEDLRLEDGELRIHVPVRTSPDVEFIVAGRRLHLRAGESWYIDFSQPHRIHNAGSQDRVHLVIDARLNDWARATIENAAHGQADPSQYPGECGFSEFRKRVLEDEGLQRRLMATPDKSALVALSVQLGRELGYRFHPDEVESAIRAGQRAWSQRQADI
jgi:mannose-6-phosphate isomerase-like protein (cupin superfamily)